MKVDNLDQMIKGWFVGDFKPTALHSKDFEVAVKKYNAGDFEPLHHHKIATEITVIVTGLVEMCGSQYSAGAIITLEPNTATDFKALEDTITVVVKTPSVPADKYLGAV